ncbi:MAG: hypothetical protein KatS3mg087_1377 [Patescibacteria group bacterium]|nr:MAG: hypothetical protein KatS3mg087_1377 [Patescibacteria group bacterium]
MKITLTTTGQSQTIFLNSGTFKVWVEVGGTLEATPQLGRKEDRPVDVVFPDGTTSVTGDKVFDITGPGYLSFDVTSITGTTEVFVDRVE